MMEKAMSSNFDELAQFTLEAMSYSSVLLDGSGIILSSNLAWQDFGRANGGAAMVHGGKENYLTTCDAATGAGSDDAHEMAEGIRSVINGMQVKFEIEYRCDSPTENRIYTARVRRFYFNEQIRIAVTHEDISHIRNLDDDVPSRPVMPVKGDAGLSVANIRQSTKNKMEYSNNLLEPGQKLSMVAAAVLITVYLAIMIILFFDASKNVFEPTLLLPVLNTIFSGILPIALSAYAMRSYINGGINCILLMGCGLMVFGFSAILAGWLMGPMGTNVNVTIYNIGALLGSIFHAFGIICVIKNNASKINKQGKKIRLAFSLFFIGIFFLLLVRATLRGSTPLFFIQGVGPTPLRQWVLGCAALLYFLSALFLIEHFRRERKLFYYWYALFLLMLSLGIVAACLQPSVGSPMGWLNRGGHYIAGIFALTAIFALYGGSRRTGTSFMVEMGTLFRQAQMSYEALIETVGDPIVSMNQVLQIIQWNSAAERKFGLCEKDVLGFSLADILLTPASALVFQSTARQLTNESCTLPFVCKLIEISGIGIGIEGGKVELKMEVSLSAARVNGQLLFVAVLRDSTQRKMAEATEKEKSCEVQNEKVKAESANKAKSHFLAAISHDLRQPLFALRLYVDMLDGALPGRSEMLLPRIKDCVCNLDDLLGDLLDISKLQTGAVAPKLTNFAMTDVLTMLLSVHSAQATQKGLRLRVHPTGWMVRTDCTMLRRIMGNLVANAIQYTSSGGVLIACRHHDRKQWLEVYDTGMGISADKIPFIFDEFSQVSRGVGSGLGLYIVAKTAELLGLQVRIRSRVGRGTMLAVELPTADIMPPVIQSIALPEASRLRAGIVEDNAEALQALTIALELMGHEVVSANTGRDLIARLDGLAPQLIVTDYHLVDGETGDAVIELARANFGVALPALIITANTNKARLNRVVPEGVLVIFKPVKMNALRVAIAQVIPRDVSIGLLT